MEASDGGHVKVLLPPVSPSLGFQEQPLDPLFCLVADSPQPPQPHNVTDTFVEIIGNTVDASTIKFMACINMGPKLGASPLSFSPTDTLTPDVMAHIDLALVNQVVELTFDSKFRGRLF